MATTDGIRQFVVGPIQTNCYALVDDGECLVVDAGASGARIAQELEDLHVVGIVATHGHHDHVCGVAALKRATGAPFAISEADAWRCEQALQISSHGFSAAENELENAPAPDRMLHEGDVVEVGRHRLQVIAAPGHTEGGIVLVGDGFAFVGDTLFAGSCGRTDLLGGDHKTLMATLARLKAEIDPKTTLLCGHGPATTMEAELATNPWLVSL